MGRRRKERGIEELVGPIIIVLFLILFWASGFDIHRTLQLVKGLIVLIVVVAVSIALFFVIRYFVRRNRASAMPTTSPQPSRTRTNMKVTPPSSATQDSTPGWRYEGPLLDETPNPDMTEPPSVVDKLRATDWYQFEKVVGLIYEAQGYRLYRRGGANPDGGIDLIIEKDGERAAVQCKRWKKWKVDVPKVRELFGAMTHEGLTRGVMVALNGFTIDAKQLAVEHNIDIVHDENLATMITGLSPADQLKVQAMLDDETKHCPKCEATMVWREPKPGKNWTPFWGCSRYPQCYGRLQED